MRRTLVLVCSMCMLFGAFPASAGAQWYNAQEPALRLPVTVEAYFGQLRPAGTVESYTVDLYGGRVLWRLAADPVESPIRSRTFVGPFGEYLDVEPRGFSSVHLGAHADMRLLTVPVGGVIDPVVSLAAGALRTSVERGFDDQPAFANRTNVSVTLTPAVGVRLGLIRGVAMRADARDMIVLRGNDRHNWQYTLGIGATF